MGRSYSVKDLYLQSFIDIDLNEIHHIDFQNEIGLIYKSADTLLAFIDYEDASFLLGEILNEANQSILFPNQYYKVNQ